MTATAFLLIAGYAAASAPAPIRELGPSAEPAGEGLYRVDPADGPAVLTHGVDPAPDSTPAGGPARAAAASTSRDDRSRSRSAEPGPIFGPGAPERAPICTESDHVQVLYGHLAGSPGRFAQVAGELRAIVRRANAQLNADSLASGGPTADLRVACAGDQIDVRELSSDETSFEAVIESARAAGLAAKSGVNYLIFLDASIDGCGTATYRDDQRPTADNANNRGGGYAVVYRDCWRESTPLHELGHMMGAVQHDAPHSTGSGGHCVDEEDVMCYSPDGGDRNQGATLDRCPTERFDCGYDTYFDAAPEPGEYLASHWNVGSPANRFIVFGAGDAAPAAEPAPGAQATGGATTARRGGLAVRLLRRGARRARARGLAAAPGGWRRTSVWVGARARKLTVRLRAPRSARLELYLRRRRAPTATRFACRARPRAHTATCRIRNPAPGRWIAGVRTRRGAGAEFLLAAVTTARPG